MEYKFNSENFKKIRKEKHLTQKALAKILVQKYNLSNIYERLPKFERGEIIPSNGELLLFAKALKVDISLISDTNDSSEIKSRGIIKKFTKESSNQLKIDLKRQDFHNHIVYQMTINLMRYLKSNKLSINTKNVCKEVIIEILEGRKATNKEARQLLNIIDDDFYKN